MAHEARADELEVLQSIYEDICQIEQETEEKCVLRLTFSESIVLRLYLPSDYPVSSPPIIDFIDTIFTAEQKKDVCDLLHSIWSKSQPQVCLYEWIETLRSEYASIIETKATVVTRIVETPRERPQERMMAEITPEDQMYHGHPVTDRKSTFQAHVASVRSLDDVTRIIKYLGQDRKIARATHNMMAYRIKISNTIDQNLDDDGEHGGASHILRLLEITKTENVMIVVSRWYGGILLGPDRFKHILSCARDALNEFHARNK